ncbi:hypothetical protein [Thermoflavifilum thermophilum]|uniref:Uncharacterized protein n=1 Tax=Thermoflavifilum thermophilum TaxID=1393122 RepID=A0A1I7NF28_9BACT|nr:hypothetical protein [Thermoflavifilum thermophilum]SFV33249.1 hypothetical protein SAMN05660895_1606 [Thermoflavifilum thermophilum]
MDNFYFRLIALFCAVNGIGIVFSHVLEDLGIDDLSGAIGNLLLALITAYTYHLGKKAIRHPNHHRFFRTVYLTTFLKIVIYAGAMVGYAFTRATGFTRNTLILLLILYFIYSILETWALFRLARTSSGHQ